MLPSPSSIQAPRAALQAAHAAYPLAWQMAEQIRETRGRPGMPDWPDWCYLPMGGWYATVSKLRNGSRPLKELAMIGDVSRLAALGTWRMTQGVFEIDAALRARAVDLSAPCAILYGLLQWCVYIVTPACTWQDRPMSGFWAHLECDANDGSHELRLLIDREDGLHPVALPLVSGSLADAVARRPSRPASAGEASRQAARADRAALETTALTGMLGDLLALMADDTVYLTKGEPGTPANPDVRKTRRGNQLFAAPSPTVWTVTQRP